jgi:hypothetical protein
MDRVRLAVNEVWDVQHYKPYTLNLSDTIVRGILHLQFNLYRIQVAQEFKSQDWDIRLHFANEFLDAG